MATFPVAGYLADALRTQSEVKTSLEAFLAATRQLPGGGGAVTTLTIASGSITPTAGAHIVGTEGAAIADDLANIAQTNFPDGSLLFLSALSSLQVIILKHGSGGAGQLALADAADLPLIDPTMVVIFRRTGALWAEVGRFYGNQGAAFRTRYDLAATASPNVFSATQEWSKGADIPATITLALGTGGNFFVVTGTTATVNGLSAKSAGTRIALKFQQVVPLTHNATSFILRPAASRQTAVGETTEFLSLGGGNWQEMSGRGEEPILNRNVTPVTVGNSAVETDIYAFTVPAGALATAKKLRLTLTGHVTDTSTGSTKTLTLRGKYGGTTVAIVAINTAFFNTYLDSSCPPNAVDQNVAIGSATPFKWVLEVDALTAASQEGLAILHMAHLVSMGGTAPAFITSLPAASPSRGTATVDSTVNQVLNVTCQWSTAAAARTMTRVKAVLELL